MKHFVVEAKYLVPFEQIKGAIPQHRDFLQQGYDKGLFLCSGPKQPPTGGFLLARAKSKEDLEAFFENEPFHRANLASFTFTEFDPVKRQSWAEHWFGETND
ncbi:MAG: YciI family protein [Xenophilus sp.]